MNRSKTLSYLMIASLTAFVGTRAQAQEYYTYQEVRRCENQGQNAAVGAVGGAIFGGILGAVLGRGSGGAVAAGAIAGGATGGLLGAGVSCRDQAVYVRHVDDYLRTAPEEGYQDDNCHVVVIGSGYAGDGHVCRTYHMDYVTEHGWAARESTACWVNGQWRHGYDADIISRRVYTNPHPRFYYEVEDSLRDRQRMYWAGQRERMRWEREHERDRIYWANERERMRREREQRLEYDRDRARETSREVQWGRYEDREDRRFNRYDYLRDQHERHEDHERHEEHEHDQRREFHRYVN